MLNVPVHRMPPDFRKLLLLTFGTTTKKKHQPVTLSRFVEMTAVQQYENDLEMIWILIISFTELANFKLMCSR